MFYFVMCSLDFLFVKHKIYREVTLEFKNSLDSIRFYMGDIKLVKTFLADL